MGSTLTIGEARQDAHRAWDRHGALYPNGQHVEVFHLYDDPIVPVYGIVEDPEAGFRVLIEGLGIAVWVMRDAPQGDPLWEHFCQTLIQAIAQGICRCTPFMAGSLQGLSAVHPAIAINVQMTPSEEWFSTESSTNGSALDSITMSVDQEHGAITLELRPDMRDLFWSANNDGDRALLQAILTGLAQLVEGDTKINSAAVIDQALPLGNDKLLVRLDVGRFPGLDGRNLVPMRLLQEEVWASTTLKASQHVIAKLSLPLGRVDQSLVTNVLNTFVAIAFDLLRDEVALLSPDKLLEFLLAHSESIIYEQSSQAALLPIKSHGDGRCHLRRFLDDQVSMTRTAVALRFLIEYAVACPPRGTRAVSLPILDGLLALAAIIVEEGMRSDICHFGLSPTTVEVIKPGLIVVNQHDHVSAQQAHATAHIAQLSSDAAEAFADLWQRDDDPEPVGSADKTFINEVNAATAEQFGVSLEHMTRLLRIVDPEI